MTRVILALVAAGGLAGCASDPSEISAAYVPPAQYASYDCAQINSELIRVSQRVNVVTGQQAKKAKNDKIATGVGVVLFWPALFFLASGDKKEELANLKGQYDALNQVALQKRCPGATGARS